MSTCGVTDGTISPANIISIVQPGVNGQEDRMVCGIIGPGTSRTLAAKWDSPMEQTNVGSQGAIEMAANGLQALSGRTSITTFSSTQIWQGNMPLKFSLNLIFIAQSNAYEEVMKPLQWLEEFASPNLNNVSPGGRIPDVVSVMIGERILYENCVIENITTPLDKEKDSDGNLIRAEVQLDIQTKTSLDSKKISEGWL